MTRIAIVGGGPAATLHAHAVRATPGVELVGVGGRPGTAGELSARTFVGDRALDDLIDDADAVVVAIPPAEVESVVGAALGRVGAILVEAPLATTIEGAIALGGQTPVMTGANLLHAPAVRLGLRAIAEKSEPHHLVLHSTGPRPTWGAHGTRAFGGGAIVDPGARLLPVLIAAAGAEVVTVSAEFDHEDGIDHLVRVVLGFADGRRAEATIEWAEGETRALLEVADRTGVVSIALLPHPSVERDGTSVATASEDPLVALGFVGQIRRLAAVARGESVPWPDLGVGIGALTIAAAAAESAARNGEEIACAAITTDGSPEARLRRR